MIHKYDPADTFQQQDPKFVHFQRQDPDPPIRQIIIITPQTDSAGSYLPIEGMSNEGEGSIWSILLSVRCPGLKFKYIHSFCSW
jgi:hypothetical protein